MGFYTNEYRIIFLPPFRYPLEYQGLKNPNGTYDHPYWFQYLPFKYLANQYEVNFCPNDTRAAEFSRSGWRSIRGGNKLTYSYALNDILPVPDKDKNPPHTYLAAQGLLQDYLERYQATSVKYLKRPSVTLYALETRAHNIMSGESHKREFRVDHGGRKERVNVLMADSHAESRAFTSIWHGIPSTGASDLKDVNTCPGVYRQLWYGSPTATQRILY
jgi:prepilin-type processing-associated H-X9-DG protein